MDNSISDMFSTSDIFDTSNMTINNNFEHLKIIFEEVLCTVSFVDVEENIFKDEIPKLKQACIEAMDQIHDHIKNIQNNTELLDEIKKLIQRYTNLLNFAHTAVKYISSKVSYTQVQSLPLAISEILLVAFKHCKESDTIYGNYFVSVSHLLTDLFKKANELQSAFLSLLNNNLVFDLTEEDQLAFLVQVAEIIAKLGEIVSGLDIKTTAELWKAYLVLLQKHNENIKDRINIEAPLKYVCTEINNNLDSIGSMSDMKHIEKTLKITSFNLKIVIKLCGLCEVSGEAIEYIFNLLITLNKNSIPYLQFQKRNPKFIDHMQSYVTVASEPLLNCLIGNREFVQFYFKNISKLFGDDEKRLSAIFITISVIKKILNADLEIRRLWISEDAAYNIIFVAFSSTDQFHAEFSLDYRIQVQGSEGGPPRTTSLYEYLLIYLASICITVDSKQFKAIQKLLFSSVMQPDLWKVVISSDIWISLGRYGSAEFCYDSLKFLISVYLKLQDSNRVEIIYLSCLIKRNYCILSNKYKTDLLSQYPCNHFIKLWTIIGINNEATLKVKLQIFIDQAIEKIDAFLRSKSVESFKSMCELLSLLSTNTFSERLQINILINKIIQLWTLNIDDQISDQPWIIKFVNSRAKITSCLMQHFNNRDILKILQSMTNLNHENLKLSQCTILKSLSTKQISSSPEQKDIFKLIATTFNKLLNDKNPVIKQQSYETFSNFAYQTSHEEILSSIAEDDIKLQDEISNYLQKITAETNQVDYFQKQSKYSFQHKCHENFKFIEPLQKKKKLDSDVNIAGVLQTMKYNCDSLVEYYKNETVTDNVVAELNVILAKLQTLLK